MMLAGAAVASGIEPSPTALPWTDYHRGRAFLGQARADCHAITQCFKCLNANPGEKYQAIVYKRNS
jgi:hypothetical protein